MFLGYWPFVALVGALVLLLVAAVLRFADTIFRVRHTALPERSLESYLPEDDLNGVDLGGVTSTSRTPAVGVIVSRENEEDNGMAVAEAMAADYNQRSRQPNQQQQPEQQQEQTYRGYEYDAETQEYGI